MNVGRSSCRGSFFFGRPGATAYLAGCRNAYVTIDCHGVWPDVANRTMAITATNTSGAAAK
jgi:hypothetical protein